jgi:branched-chain amino acid transport system substrate-binding protein
MDCPRHGVFALLTACSVLLVSCGQGAPATPAAELKIGEIDPITGVLAAQGTAVHQGITYAVDEVNAHGGVNGHKVRLVTRDDGGQPAEATTAAEDLLTKENVSALVGGYVDSLVGPIAQVAGREHAPYVASSSLDQRLTQRGNAYFFRVSRLQPFVDATTALPLELAPANPVAILYSSTPGATQLAQLQRDRLQGKGVQVSSFESFQTGTPDFAPLLARVNAGGAQALLVDGFFGDHLVLLRQAHGPPGALKAVLGAFGMEFPALIAQLGPLAEGAIGTISWEPGLVLSGDAQASRAYVTGFTQHFGHAPVPLTMHGYTAARAVLGALAKSGSGSGVPGRDAVRDALRSTDLKLPLEHLQFDDHGDPLHYEIGLFQIQQGKHVVVWPKDHATGKLIYPAL